MLQQQGSTAKRPSRASTRHTETRPQAEHPSDRTGTVWDSWPPQIWSVSPRGCCCYDRGPVDLPSGSFRSLATIHRVLDEFACRIPLCLSTGSSCLRPPGECPGFTQGQLNLRHKSTGRAAWPLDWSVGPSVTNLWSSGIVFFHAQCQIHPGVENVKQSLWVSANLIRTLWMLDLMLKGAVCTDTQRSPESSTHWPLAQNAGDLADTASLPR